MENIEFLCAQSQSSLAGEIAVSHKNNILADRIFLLISGRKQISAQPLISSIYYSLGTDLFSARNLQKYSIIQNVILMTDSNFPGK